MDFGDNLNQVKEILRLVQVKDFQNEQASQDRGWLQRSCDWTLGAQLSLVLRQSDGPYDLYSLPFWMGERERKPAARHGGPRTVRDPMTRDALVILSRASRGRPRPLVDSALLPLLARSSPSLDHPGWPCLPGQELTCPFALKKPFPLLSGWASWGNVWGEGKGQIQP